MNKNLKKYINAVLFLIISSNSFAAQQAPLVSFSEVRDLTFLFNGLISENFARSGQIVTKGDVLTQMDDALLQLEIKKAKAKLDAAEASFTDVKQQHERALELFDRDVLSQVDMDKSLVLLEKNKASHTEQLENLNILKKKQSYYKLIAPYDAVVLDNPFYKGKLIINDIKPQTMIKLAAKDKIQFTLKNKIRATKQILKVKVNNKNYKAKLIAATYQKNLFNNVYQIQKPNAYLLVGKKVTNIRK